MVEDAGLRHAVGGEVVAQGGEEVAALAVPPRAVVLVDLGAPLLLAVPVGGAAGGLDARLLVGERGVDRGARGVVAALGVEGGDRRVGEAHRELEAVAEPGAEEDAAVALLARVAQERKVQQLLHLLARARVRDVGERGVDPALVGEAAVARAQRDRLGADVAPAVVAAAAGVFVVGQDVVALLGHEADRVRPVVRGAAELCVAVRVAVGAGGPRRVPVLHVAELEQVARGGVDAQQGHQARLVAVGVGLVAVLVALEHVAVAHLLAERDVAARRVAERVVDLGAGGGVVVHAVEADRLHRDAERVGLPVLGEEREGDVEAAGRQVVDLGAVLLRGLDVLALLHREHHLLEGPDLAGERQRVGLVERMDVLGPVAVGRGEAGGEAVDRPVAEVHHRGGARGVVGVVDREHVGRAGLDPLPFAEAPRDERGLALALRGLRIGDGVHRDARLAEDVGDVAAPGGIVAEAVGRVRGALDRIDQREFAELLESRDDVGEGGRRHQQRRGESGEERGAGRLGRLGPLRPLGPLGPLGLETWDPCPTGPTGLKGPSSRRGRPPLAPRDGALGAGRLAADFLGAPAELGGVWCRIEAAVEGLVPDFAAGFGARGVHALAHAAELPEVLLLALDHAVEERPGLVAEREHQVAERLFRTALEDLLPVVPVGMRLGEGARRDRALVRCAPGLHAAGAEAVEVVLAQFVERRAGDVRELDLGLLARSGGGASFRDVLLAASRGLHHLVDRPVAARGQEPPAEGDRALVDGFALSVDDQLAVAAVGQHDGKGPARGLGPLGPLGPLGLLGPGTWDPCPTGPKGLKGPINRGGPNTGAWHSAVHLARLPHLNSTFIGLPESTENVRYTPVASFVSTGLRIEPSSGSSKE